MSNLFVSYDLNAPGKDYSKVFDAIKSLGSWAKVQKSFWYVNSSLTADAAATKVWAVMDVNDSLIVIDSTNNSASWRGAIPSEVGKHMQDNWMK